MEQLLSKSLGPGKLTVEDMAARPSSGEVHLAVSTGATKTPAIVAVTSDQKVRKFDLASIKSTALKNANDSKYDFWRETPERSFTVADMKWNGGELFVAGLSNQDFASTLRRIPYPFTDKQTMTSVEIYHTTHDQIETRAPIRALSFATLDGRPYIVAAYTCTPIVTIPLEALKDGAHVKAKVIAELGYGNTPADMISYSTKDASGKPQDMLMLLNYFRSANIMPVSEVEAANEKPGIDKPVPPGEIVGVRETEAPLMGATRIDNLDDQFFIVVRRALENDALQLVSFDKAMLFRLSEFVSEYNFPQYRYNDEFQLKYFNEAVALMLGGQEIKRWRVGPDDLDGPHPSGWNVGRIVAGTREPLTVQLDDPIDGRDVDYLAVADSSSRRIQGRAQLKVGENGWTFTPDAPWNELRYTLAVFGNLEDPSGNRMNELFETPENAPEPTVADVSIPLTTDRALATP